MSMQNFYKQLQAAPKPERPFSIFALLNNADVKQIKNHKSAYDWTQW